MISTAGTGLYGLDATGGFIAGQDVAVFGPGPVGLMTVQACHQLGANSVTLVGTRASRLEAGRRCGADHLVNVRERDPVEAILEITDGRGVDLAVECSGAVVAPQQCAQAIKRGGKLLVVAFYPGPVELDLSHVVRSDITIYTTRGEGGNNVKRAVSLAAQGPAVGRRAGHAPLRPRRHRGGVPASSASASTTRSRWCWFHDHARRSRSIT